MRQEIPIVVLGADGRPAAGASVYVRTDPGGADATIYQARTGAATHPNPRTSDAQGRVEGWLERGDYAGTVTVGGLPPWVESFPITSANDGHLDLAEVPDGLVTSVKLTPNVRPSNLYRLGVHSARPAATAVEPGTVWRSTDKWMEWLSDGATWTLISAEPQPVSAVPPAAPALPATAPLDGQRIDYQDAANVGALGMRTQGLRWVLRYSTNTGGWEWEGGGLLSVGAGAAATTGTGSTWSYQLGDGTYAISLTAPAAGNYWVQASAEASHNVDVVAVNAGVGAGRGTGGATDASPQISGQAHTNGGGQVAPCRTDGIVNNVSTSQIIALTYLYTARALTYQQRTLRIRPHLLVSP